MNDALERIFHRLSGELLRRWPYARPSSDALHACRIISHRGEHDNRTVLENTLEAFDTAASAGVWGLELDVRWTRDLVPVVHHDTHARRLYGKASRIGDMEMDTIRTTLPAIPTLSEVIDRYGDRLHLMIEVKAEPYPDPTAQSRTMERLLSTLCAGKEFHLMSLHPELFGYFDFLPANAFIPIAQTRVQYLSRLSAGMGWNGLAGHVLMIGKRVIARHHSLGRRVGTGFVDSVNCLFREVHRGVDWLFSNRAAAMQAICRTGEDRQSENALHPPASRASGQHPQSNR